jgi:hypothetical protein
MILIFAKLYDSTFLGKYFYYTSFIAILTLVIDFGFNLSALRGLTDLLAKSHQSSDVSKFISSIQFAKYILSVISLLGFFLLYIFNVFIFESVFHFGLLLVIGIIVSLTNFSWIFYALNESQVYSTMLFLFRVSSLVLIFIFKISLIQAIVLTFIPLVVVNLFVLLSVANKHKIALDLFKRVSASEIVVQFKAGYVFFINSIVISLGVTFWPIIFGKFLSYPQIAAFGIMDKFTRGIVSLISPLPNFLLAKTNPFLSLISFVKKNLRIFVFALLVLFLMPISFNILPSRYLSLFIGDDILANRKIMNVYAYHFLIGFLSYLSMIFVIHFRQEMFYTIIFIVSYLIWLTIGYFSGIIVYLPILLDLTCVLFIIVYLFKKKYLDFSHYRNI